jgi:hypothetical protein
MARILAMLLTWVVALCPGAAQNVAAPVATAGIVAGKIELVEGDVTIYDRGKTARRVRVGDALYEGDGVVTGRNGELHVAMDDGGYLAVRSNTSMSVIAYQAQGRDDDRSVFNLVAGSFRSITGWIGRHNPRAYQVRTQTATIGIRGTDHEPMVIPDGSPAGEAGTYDKVNAGGTYIESTQGHGRIDVTPNRAGFAPLRGRPAPRLLAEVPRLYRPTRYEQRLVNRHQAAQKGSERLREDRRRMLEERRKALEERKDARKAEMKREQQKNAAQRSEPQKEAREKRLQEQAEDRKEMQDARRKETESRREKQQEPRASRAQERGQKAGDSGKPKAEVHRREGRDDASRNRGRD